jgi:Cytosol aminopeptidase family, N-terminal domain
MPMTNRGKALRTFFITSILCSVSLAYAQTAPAAIDAAKSPVPIQVLVQSPVDTNTELQIICLFQSTPVNKLAGSLAEANEKLNGLLDRVRNPSLFRGELGETLLLVPPAKTIAARKLLIIGLGDSQTFSPDRMQLVGEIAYSEATRLGVARPFFAPTIIDGGVSKFSTGQVAEQVILGFLRAADTQRALTEANTSNSQVVAGLTFLAGQQHAADTLQGITKATRPR